MAGDDLSASGELSDELMRSATSGCQADVDALIALSAPRVLAYVRLHMGPGLRARETSQDIVQSACREALEDAREGFEYRGRAAFLSWLFSTALNKVRERHRYHHRERRTPARELREEGVAELHTLLTPSRCAMARENAAMIEDAFHSLTDDDRDVILFSRVIGMSCAEIAEQMDCSPAAAQARLGRAMARLSRAYERRSKN